MAPGPNEVRIRQTAVGVNYIDVYVRKGLYRMIQPPAAIGMEAAGVVLDVGDGVAHLLPGDRVAYACPPPGAYATVRTMPADQVVVLPDDVSDETAAAVMLKGMTAEFLLHRTQRVRPGQAVLVHAAAGGVGLLLCQWAKALGAKVIGTVSSEDKARLARDPRLRVSDRDAGLSLCPRSEEPHPRAWCRRDLRRPGPRGRGREPRSARVHRPLGLLWPSERTARGAARPGREIGHAVAARALPLHRGARRAAGNRGECLQGAARTRRFAWSCATAIRSRRPPKRTASSKRGARRDRSCCCPDFPRQAFSARTPRFGLVQPCGRSVWHTKLSCQRAPLAPLPAESKPPCGARATAWIRPSPALPLDVSATCRRSERCFRSRTCTFTS